MKTNKEHILHNMKNLAPHGITPSEKSYVWSKIEEKMHKENAPRFEFTKLNRGRLRSMRKAFIPLVVGIAILTGSAATAYASNAKPGDLFFPIEVATENARVFLAQTPKKKQELRIKFAEKRLTEVRELTHDIKTDKNLLALTDVASTTITSATQNSPSNDFILPPSTEKKIKRAQKALDIARTHLEDTKRALKNEGNEDGSILVDDILSELDGVGEDAKNITAYAHNGRNNYQKNIQEITNVATETTSSQTLAIRDNKEQKNNTKFQIKKNVRVMSSHSPQASNANNSSEDIKEMDIVRDTLQSKNKKNGDNRPANKIRICHLDHNAESTLLVTPSEARKYLSQGDKLGNCETLSSNGKVLQNESTQHKPLPSANESEHNEDKGKQESPTLPHISDLQTTPLTDTATIKWTTDEPASLQFWFGTSEEVNTGRTPDTVRNSLLTSHLVTLTNLSPETTYHFAFTVIDINSKQKNYTGSLKTKPVPLPPELPSDRKSPTISGVSIAVASTSAIIDWNTDEPATGTLYLDDASSFSPSITSHITLPTLANTQHVVKQNLSASTTYNFIIVATDASGNTATGTTESFATSD